MRIYPKVQTGFVNGCLTVNMTKYRCIESEKSRIQPSFRDALQPLYMNQNLTSDRKKLIQCWWYGLAIVVSIFWFYICNFILPFVLSLWNISFVLLIFVFCCSVHSVRMCFLWTRPCCITHGWIRFDYSDTRAIWRTCSEFEAWSGLSQKIRRKQSPLKR